MVDYTQATRAFGTLTLPRGPSNEFANCGLIFVFQKPGPPYLDLTWT